MIVEPVVGNLGVIRPMPSFLPGIKSFCDHHGTLLVFDEVMTGFRFARGGAPSATGSSRIWSRSGR